MAVREGPTHSCRRLRARATRDPFNPAYRAGTRAAALCAFCVSARVLACIWRRRLRVAWSSRLRHVSRESPTWKRGAHHVVGKFVAMPSWLPLMLLAIAATSMAPCQYGGRQFGGGNARNALSRRSPALRQLERCGLKIEVDPRRIQKVLTVIRCTMVVAKVEQGGMAHAYVLATADGARTKPTRLCRAPANPSHWQERSTRKVSTRRGLLARSRCRPRHLTNYVPRDRLRAVSLPSDPEECCSA